jgi:hypothetical protein
VNKIARTVASLECLGTYWCQSKATIYINGTGVYTRLIVVMDEEEV